MNTATILVQHTSGAYIGQLFDMEVQEDLVDVFYEVGAKWVDVERDLSYEVVGHVDELFILH